MKMQGFNLYKPVNKIDHMTFKDGRKYQIVAHSTDARRFHHYCSDKTSALAKLLNLTNNNLAARTLFFIDFDRSFRHPFENAQEKALQKSDALTRMTEITSLYSVPASSLMLPIVSESVLANLEAILAKSLRRATKASKPNIEAFSVAWRLFSDAADSAMTHYITVLAKMVASDREYARRIRRGALQRNELRELTSKIVDKVRPEFEDKLAKAAETISKKYEEMPSTSFKRFEEYYQRVRLWSIYEKAFEYITKICCEEKEASSAHFYGLVRQLKKLEIVEDVRLEGICLNPDNECSNVWIKYGTGELSFKCEECGGEYFSWLAISPIQKNIYHAWKMHYLPEMIVAALLSKPDWVDKLFVREKIRQEQPKTTKNFEVDVIIKTRDDKLVLVETSVHHSLDDAIPTAQKKSDNLSTLNFDALFYIAPLEISEYFSIGQKSYVLGLKHFSDIPGFIHEIIETKVH